LFPIISGGNISLARPSPYADMKTKLGRNTHEIVIRITNLVNL